MTIRTHRAAAFTGTLLLLLALSPTSPLDAAPTPPQKCAAAKNKAAAKKLAAKLKCHQKAMQLGVAVDAICLATAELKFDQAIAKAELAGGCIVAGDGPAIEAAVDGCVTEVVTLTPATTTTLPPDCCSYGDECLWTTSEVCLITGGSLGAPGSVCGATGACGAPPAVAGSCCGQPGRCSAGPVWDDPSVCTAAGLIHHIGVCTPEGSCVP